MYGYISEGAFNGVVGSERYTDSYRSLHPVHAEALEEAAPTF